MNEVTRNEVIRLWYGGASGRRIARQLHVSRKSVARVVAEHHNRRKGVPPAGGTRRPKSHVIQALGLKACSLGYRVCYRTSAALLADLTASLADKTLPQRVRYYSRPHLLIIDEFGFDKIERSECPQAAHMLYKIVAARNQKRSTALVTNIDFDKWGDYLPDGPLAMALLDRLVEKAIILKIKGRSYRAHCPKDGDKPA